MSRRSCFRLVQIAGTSILAGIVLWSCSTVPVTGRKQLHMISDSEMIAMSDAAYDTFLMENPVSTDRAGTAMVKRVGTRIQGAVETFFRERNESDQLTGYKWEFNLVQSDQVNAWCMSGGKVVVYTGLLPVCKDESGLAVVMGHEIAHAVAKHGAERMSQALVAEGLGTVLSAALSKEPTKTKQLWMTAFGVGAQYGVLLPFSRTQESEADHLGLIFMAMAGYDPNAALSFWERMAKGSPGTIPPEIMSTHPSDATRIADLKKLMPEAMTYYKPVAK